MCYLTNFREMFWKFSKNLSNSAQIFHETVIKLYILFTTGLLVKQLLLDAHDNQDFRFVSMFWRICVFIGWQCTHRVLPVGPVAQLVERDWRPEDRGLKSHWTFFLYFSSSFLLSTFPTVLPAGSIAWAYGRTYYNLFYFAFRFLNKIHRHPFWFHMTLGLVSQVYVWQHQGGGVLQHSAPGVLSGCLLVSSSSFSLTVRGGDGVKSGYVYRSGSYFVFRS